MMILNKCKNFINQKMKKKIKFTKKIKSCTRIKN